MTQLTRFCHSNTEDFRVLGVSERERERESERGFWEFEVNAPTESIKANKKDQKLKKETVCVYIFGKRYIL